MSELIALILISICILLTNGTVCWLFYSRPRLNKKPENGLFCSQALGDILNIVLIALFICEEQRLIPRDVLPFLLNYMIFLSLFGLFALTFDRYWSITNALQRRHLFDHRFLAVELILVWVLPLAPSMINLTAVLHPKAIFLHKILYCLMTTVITVFFIVLVTLHVFVYINVRNIRQTDASTRVRANIACESTRNNDWACSQASATTNQCEMTSTERNGILTGHGRNKHERNLTLKKEILLAKMTLIMLILYFIGHMPTIYLNLAYSFERYDLITNFTIQFSLYSFFMNSFINPLLCIFVKPDFKSAFYTWLPCLCGR